MMVVVSLSAEEPRQKAYAAQTTAADGIIDCVVETEAQSSGLHHLTALTSSQGSHPFALAASTHMKQTKLRLKRNRSTPPVSMQTEMLEMARVAPGLRLLRQWEKVKVCFCFPLDIQAPPGLSWESFVPVKSKAKRVGWRSLSPASVRDFGRRWS
jgi:hypothetical protein